jgi:4'-phosphopantetheinyl transferase
VIQVPGPLHEDGAVHVWKTTTASLHPEDLAVLDSAEREQAQRFRFQEDRDLYIHAHAALRRILSSYTAIPACDLFFERGPYGKPELRSHSLRFNLSHSAGNIVIAVALQEVGVDIEFMRADLDLLDIAQHFFSPRELALVAAAGAGITRTFYRIWTCKEAYMKATGMGFSLPSRSFDVCGDGQLGVLNSQTHPGWSLSEFPCAEGFAAAVVTQGVTSKVHVCDYAESCGRPL